MKRFFLVTILAALIFGGCTPAALKQLRQAEYALARGDESQLETILMLLEGDTEISREAANALGRSGNPRAIGFLVEKITSRSAVSEQAVNALGLIGDKRATPVLINLIKNDMPEARAAIKILGQIKDARAVPVLMNVVNERRPYFIEAIDVLGILGDERAVDLLINELRNAPVDEPGSIKFRIAKKDDDNNQQHTIVFDVPQNLPPKIAITESRIAPEGFIFFRYILQDAEYDSLNLIPEFSVNNGRNWHRASSEGAVESILEDQYQGSIVWRADLDNIPYTSQTQLLFKLTPSDFFNGTRKGVPKINTFSVDSASVDINTPIFEESGEINFSVYYPNPQRAIVDSFAIHYSLDNGDFWLPASVRRGLTTIDSDPDSMYLIWDSNQDIDGVDNENVLLRISSNKNNMLGKMDISEPFHVDNNDVPTVAFANFIEGDLFSIGYNISDAEMDNVSLLTYYSLDKGQSWKQATSSGDYSSLMPDQYSGILRWFADFDVNTLRESTIRLRLRPADNDAGLFSDSKDFFLRDLDFSKLTQGKASGMIGLTIPVASEDSLRPYGEYTTDGGRTWKPATLTDIQDVAIKGRRNLNVNWDFPNDVSTNLRQIEAIGMSLNRLGSQDIVPDLIRIARNTNSSSRVRRQQAIEANRILEKRPDWVIQGLIKSLMHEDKTVSDDAMSILTTLDNPDVNMALIDYHKYFNDLRKSNLENRQYVAELDEQNYQQTLADIPPPTNKDIVNFLMGRGMTEDKSENFIKDLDVLKQRSSLKLQYDNGQISYDSYMLQLKELIDSAKKRHEEERRKAAGVKGLNQK